MKKKAQSQNIFDAKDPVIIEHDENNKEKNTTTKKEEPSAKVLDNQREKRIKGKYKLPSCFSPVLYSLLGGFLGGTFVLGALYTSYKMHSFPFRDFQQAFTKIDKNTNALKDLSEKVSFLKGSEIASLNGQIENFANNAKNTQNQINELYTQLETLTQQIKALENRNFSEKSPDLKATTPIVPSKIIEDNSALLSSIEHLKHSVVQNQQDIVSINKFLNKISAQEQRMGEKTSLFMLAHQLQNAINSGQPFAELYEEFKTKAPKTIDLSFLEPYTQKGLQDHKLLYQEFQNISIAMVKNLHAPQKDAKFLEKLWDSAKSLVTIRLVGNVAGNQPEAVLARMEKALEDRKYQLFFDEEQKLPKKLQDMLQNFDQRLGARWKMDYVEERLFANIFLSSPPALSSPSDAIERKNLQVESPSTLTPSIK